MLKRLRWKFVLINMILVSLVLFTVLGIQLVSSVHRTQAETDSALQQALQWGSDGPGKWEMGGGTAPQSDPAPTDSKTPTDSLAQGGPKGGFTILPVACVTLDSSNEVSNVVANNADISDDVLDQAVSSVMAGGATSGELSSLGLRYRMSTDSGQTRIAFVDTAWETSSIRTQLVTSGAVCLAALVGFFFISLFLSSMAMRPVEKSWKQQQQFVADASHELKTPLTVMLADTNILLSHPDDTIRDQAKWVEYIQDEAGRMKDLVEDMLFLTRSDCAAEKDAVWEPVSLSDLAWNCLLPFEPVAFENGVTLDSDIAPDLTVCGDVSKLRRLIVILLDNACKYAGKGGTVTLKLEQHPEKDKVTLSVHNTGDPIPPEAQEHLFERFYRADAARARSKGGYGLGLSIAQSIVETHHGKLAVASSAEKGTTFTATLPMK